MNMLNNLKTRIILFNNFFKKIFFSFIIIFFFFSFFNLNNNYSSSVKNFEDGNVRYNNSYPITDIEVVEINSDSFTFVLKNFSKRQGNQTYDGRYKYEFYQDLNLVNEFEVVKFIETSDKVDIYLKYIDLKSSTSYTIENVYFYFSPLEQPFEYDSDDLRILSLSSNPLIIKTKLSSLSRKILYSLIVLIILIIIFSVYKLTSKLRRRNEEKQETLYGGY